MRRIKSLNQIKPTLPLGSLVQNQHYVQEANTIVQALEPPHALDANLENVANPPFRAVISHTSDFAGLSHITPREICAEGSIIAMFHPFFWTILKIQGLRS